MKLKKAHTPNKLVLTKSAKKFLRKVRQSNPSGLFRKVKTGKKKIIDLDEFPEEEPKVLVKKKRGRPKLDESERKTPDSDKFAYYIGEKYVAVTEAGETGESVYPWEAINACVDVVRANRKKKIVIGKPKPVQISVYVVTEATEAEEVADYVKTFEWEGPAKPKFYALVWGDQKFGPSPCNRRGGGMHRTELKPYVPRKVVNDEGVEFEIVKGKGKKKKKKMVLKFSKKHLKLAKKAFPKLKFKQRK